MEEYAGLDTLEASIDFENALSFLIDDLQYTNLNQRGFMVVNFKNEEVVTTWSYLNNYDSTVYTMDDSRKTSLKTINNSIEKI